MRENLAEIGVFQALSKALGQFDDPKIQAIVWKSLLGALVIFALLGLGLWFVAGWLVSGLSHWIDWLAHFGTLILTVALSWFLFPVAVTAVVGFFLEAVAGAVEARYYPGRPAARQQPFLTMIWSGLRFACIALLLNLALLPAYLLLLLFPPLYLLVFYSVNGYLLGREYFELVAYRRLEERDADELRRACRGRVTLAGVVMTFMLTIPVFNLVAPIAATAFAVHLFEAMRRERPVERNVPTGVQQRGL
jgi:CysZ protein